MPQQGDPLKPTLAEEERQENLTLLPVSVH
jgi:hypothetical protein